MAGMSERMLDSLGGFGSAEDVQAAVQRYIGAGAISSGVSPIPGVDAEATLRAGAELI